jgi:PAS domain S-box-containing protein
MARPLRVLIVEDSPDDAELMVLVLRRGGFEPSWRRVETAGEMRAALPQGPGDLVLWDYTLPGFEATAALALLQTAEDLPFIVVSGTIGEEQAVRLMKAGADDHLLKGNLARLAPAVERTLREAADRQARKQAQAERDRLLGRLRLQIERLPLAYILFDAGHRVLDWNPAAEKVFGSAREEMVGRVALDLLVPFPVSDHVQDVLRRLRAGDMDAHSVNENRTKDGRIITCEWFNTPLTDPAGCFAGTISLAQDITERKRAQEGLRESEERFRRCFELGLIGMALTSPTKGILEVNDEICKILGYERNELLQMTWAEMTHPDDLAADVTQFDRVMKGEIDGHSTDKRWIRKDGQVVYSSISVRCLRGADGAVDCFVALLQDITNRKRAEEEVRVANERLDLAMRGSSIGIRDLDLAPGGDYRHDPVRFINVWEPLGYDPAEFPTDASASRALGQPDDLARVLDHAEVRRHRPGPGDRRPAGGPDGRLDHPGQRAGPGEHLHVHGPAEAAAVLPGADRPPPASGARPGPGPGGAAARAGGGGQRVQRAAPGAAADPPGPQRSAGGQRPGGPGPGGGGRLRRAAAGPAHAGTRRLSGRPGDPRAGAGHGAHLPAIALTAPARKEDREHGLAAGMDDYLAKPVRGAELFAAVDRVVAAEAAARSGRPQAGDGTSLLDPAALLAACDGDAEGLREMCKDLSTFAPARLAEAVGALGDQDAPRLREAARKRYGLLSAFSTVAGNVASDLEGRAAAGRLDEARALVARLNAMTQELIRQAEGLSLESLRRREATAGS